MAISSALCTSFKQEIFEARHNFLASGGSVIKMALIKNAPAGTYNAGSNNYSNVTDNSDEVANGNGYTTGGNTLVNINPAVSGTVAYVDFADTSWVSATFITSGCMIYNSSAANRALCVHDFGGNQSVVSGTLTVLFPPATAANAIIRIGMAGDFSNEFSSEFI